MSCYHKSKPQHHDLQQSQLAGGGGIEAGDGEHEASDHFHFHFHFQSQLAGGGGVEAGDGELHEASDRANLRPSHSNLRLTIGQTCWLINSDQFINQPDAID